MKYQKGYKPSAFSQSKLAKFMGMTLFTLCWGFSLFATIYFIDWFNPNPETAPAWRRLAADLLCFPMFCILGLATSFASIISMIWIGKKLHLEDSTEEVEPSRDFHKDSEREAHPSEAGYWLLVLFFGSLFFVGLYFILQDMLIRHIPAEDWTVLGFLIVIMGIPVFFGIHRIGQLRRGEPVDAPKPTTLSPVAGHFVACSLFGLVLLGLGIGAGFAAQETLRFQKIAKPAVGIVTRWVYHRGYRSGHYNVEVRYQTPDGRTRTLQCENNIIFDFSMPNVGETVNLLYNPNNPVQVRINQFSQMWSEVLFCGFLFAFFAGMLGFRFLIHGWAGNVRAKESGGIHHFGSK